MKLRLLRCAPVAMMFSACALSQRITLPAHLPSAHPRISTQAGGSLDEVRARVRDDADAHEALEQAKTEVAPYTAHVAADPMWLASRLQMYWKTHATEVYNRGDVFDHADGHAPVPTVRYPGARSATTIYKMPRLEDIPPYEDDTRGVWVVNGTLPSQPLEWADPSKTGRLIESINNRILHLAATAARLYWITGEESYAQVAFPVLDTYLRGMAYRKEPVDMTHGHSQTIYGMSTFEVIQESILQDVATTYDFMRPYLDTHAKATIPVYADAMRHWIDLTITNGVPFNNWDLIEARFIAAVALVLEDDGAYTDGRGEQHYLNAVLNDSVLRQWSLSKLAARGFDADTAIWFESPGYSMGVVGDFIGLINELDAALGSDLLPQLAVVGRAVFATGEYLYPNGYTVSFGDGHHVLLSSHSAREMVKNAQQHHRKEQELRFTAMVERLEKNADAAGHPEAADARHGFETIFTPKPDGLAIHVEAMPAAELEPALFSAPSVSYLVQRNGLDPEDGLMAAEAGSLGNHQHANGIDLEMYGRGMVLAPESGIGTSYFDSDYLGYYSQFTASNTVAVDGVSSYPAMKSQHGFQVLATYPRTGIAGRAISSATPPVTFTDVYFHEPETDADQRRLVSIVRTSPATGFYVDIFRSRRRDGKDKMHDYFFHGLGQSMTLVGLDGNALPLKPTESLSFADEELPGYDFFWSKRSTHYAGAFHADFSLTLPDKEVQMKLWMAGAPDRELFAVNAPASHAAGFLPKDIADLPMPTLVARQSGEAWNRPFVAVYEPVDTTHPSAIARIERFTPERAPTDFVGLEVRGNDGSTQLLFSAVKTDTLLHYKDILFRGTFGVVGEREGSEYLVLGDGTEIANEDIDLQLGVQEHGAAALRCDEVLWALDSSSPLRLIVASRKLGDRNVLRVEGTSGLSMWVTGIAVLLRGRPAMQYSLPELTRAHLSWHTTTPTRDRN